MPYVKVCRCECVFMQLRLMTSGTTVFIWSVSSCYNSQSCSQSVPFLLPHWSLILIGDRHQKFNFLTLLGPAFDSENDLEIQTWCSSVNEVAYLEKDPQALKHSWYIDFQEIAVMLLTFDHGLKLSPYAVVNLDHWSFHIPGFKTSIRPYTGHTLHSVKTSHCHTGFLYEFLSGMQWFGIMRCINICDGVFACVSRLCRTMNKFGDSSPW